jgi:hypothetical protein
VSAAFDILEWYNGLEEYRKKAEGQRIYATRIHSDVIGIDVVYIWRTLTESECRFILTMDKREMVSKADLETFIFERVLIDAPYEADIDDRPYGEVIIVVRMACLHSGVMPRKVFKRAKDLKMAEKLAIGSVIEENERYTKYALIMSTFHSYKLDELKRLSPAELEELHTTALLWMQVLKNAREMAASNQGGAPPAKQRNPALIARDIVMQRRLQGGG